MKIKKTDLMIIHHSENSYSVDMLKKVFWFFKRWVPVTYSETENSKELPLEFKTFEDAKNFIENTGY